MSTVEIDRTSVAYSRNCGEENGTVELLVFTGRGWGGEKKPEPEEGFTPYRVMLEFEEPFNTIFSLTSDKARELGRLLITVADEFEDAFE